MLHRLSLRILPHLALAVTDPEVRKRKRTVMLVTGLVAFVLYRVLKLAFPLSDVMAVLGVSAVFTAVTAACCYRIGRQVPCSSLLKQDGPARIGWVVGWVGLAYGVQLSLMVLAILRVFVNYDFLVHPDGPAMMAILIACTSVARDAFEIGHVRFLQHSQRPVMTFPDGAALRELVKAWPGTLAAWVGLGMVGCALASAAAASFGGVGQGELVQLLVVTVCGGSFALVAHLAGSQAGGRAGNSGRDLLTGWWAKFRGTSWLELFRFWWWPGVTFAATYFLVFLGALVYVFGVTNPGLLSQSQPLLQPIMAGLVGGMLVLSCYYLGVRRTEEDRVRQEIPASLLRCPFVMGILSKTKRGQQAQPDPSAQPESQLQGSVVAVNQSQRQG